MYVPCNSSHFLFQPYLVKYCDTVRRAQLIKSATINKGMFQKDGVALYASGVVRYIETVVPPIRMAIDSISGRGSLDSELEEVCVVSSGFLCSEIILAFLSCFV